MHWAGQAGRAHQRRLSDSPASFLPFPSFLLPFFFSFLFSLSPFFPSFFSSLLFSFLCEFLPLGPGI